MRARLLSSRLAWALVVPSIAHAVIQLQVTIVNVALPRIGGDLDASVAELQWIMVAYALPFAALLLSAGTLSDRIGSRLTFVIGCALFSLFSLVATVAPDTSVLLAARGLQGAGAALLLPSSLALLRAGYGHDPGRLAWAVAVWAAVGGASFAAGPVVGGLVVEMAGWRGIFVVMAAACLLSMIGAMAGAGAGSQGDRRPFDWPGQILLAVALACLVKAMIDIPRHGPGDPVVVATLGAALVAGAAFLVAEARAASPALPLALFRNADFSAPALIGFLINLTYTGLIFVVSLYLQSAVGYSTLDSGLAFLPLTATLVFANLIAGSMIRRHGPRRPMVAGSVIGVVGYLLLLPLDASSTFADMLPGFVLVPLGLGLTVPAITTAILSSLDESWSGTASGVLNAARQTGSAVGIALLGAFVGTAGGATTVDAMRLSAVVSAALLSGAAIVALTVTAGRRAAAPAGPYEPGAAAKEERP